MDKLKDSPTIVMGNSKQYAEVLVDLQELKEIQTGVNKVNAKLNDKWLQLIADITRISENNEFDEETTTKINGLLTDAENEQDKLSNDIIVEIKELIDDLQGKINGFADNTESGNADTKKSDRAYNSVLKDFKAILKDAKLDNGTEADTDDENTSEPDVENTTEPDNETGENNEG